MGQLEGKVALITGAARGQEQSPVVRLAEEGAGIVASDSYAQISSVSYPMSTPDDLKETHGLIGLVPGYASDRASHSIRVNSIHSTGVRTPMAMNSTFAACAEKVHAIVEVMVNAMPVDVVEPVDISNAVGMPVGMSRQ